jgi:hypothetical protein
LFVAGCESMALGGGGVAATLVTGFARAVGDEDDDAVGGGSGLDF